MEHIQGQDIGKLMAWMSKLTPDFTCLLLIGRLCSIVSLITFLSALASVSLHHSPLGAT